MAYQRVLAAVVVALCMLSMRPADAAANLYLAMGGYDDCPDLNYYDGATGNVRASYCFRSRGISGIAGLALDTRGKLFMSAENPAGLGSIITLGGAFEVPHAQSGGLMHPGDLAFGPNGNLFVINRLFSSIASGVLQYDGHTGAFLGSFVEPGSGGLVLAGDLLFVGNSLLLSDWQRGILRYDAFTGAFIDTFVALGSGGLQQPGFLKQGPGDDVFVSDQIQGVLRYDGESGNFLETFLPPAGTGHDFLGDIAFGSDGDIYVDDDSELGGVSQYDSTTREFVGGVNGSFGESSAQLILAAPAIPEPSTWALLLAGLAVVGVAQRRSVR